MLSFLFLYRIRAERQAVVERYLKIGGTLSESGNLLLLARGIR